MSSPLEAKDNSSPPKKEQVFAIQEQEEHKNLEQD
jgi:hypothetical protein